MKNINVIKGEFNSNNKKVGIVLATFNHFVTESLLNGAVECLIKHNVKEEDITVAYVPGAFEIPLVIKKMAKSKKYDSIIALGAVIRGATPHFDYVASFSSNGTAQIGLEYEIPVLNGILTVENIEQAIERAGTKAGNKGWDCAMAALEMMSLIEKI
jgi:6,7-dimethyl-8-ribityllumazine synthase